MCGRMTLAWSDLDEVADALEATYDEQLRGLYRPRYNIAPTDRHPVVILGPGADASEVRRLNFAGWGFFRGAKRPPLFNARSETAALRDSFRQAFAARRCVVPADGFYEWSGPKDARQPHWIHRRDGGLLLMAGLYEDGPTGAPAAPGSPGDARFSVLTTSPNQLVAPLHDRMPVILEPADVDLWLRKGPPELLKPADEDILTTQVVSARVNSVKNDDPACLLPPQTQAPRQLRLI